VRKYLPRGQVQGGKMGKGGVGGEGIFHAANYNPRW